MGRVLTNNVSLEYAIESTELTAGVVGLLKGETGAPAGVPQWFTLEPNSYGTIGTEITTVPRNPISNTRQRRKGAITDIDSSAEFEIDTTFSHMIDFSEGFVMAKFDGAIQFVPTSSDADSYTVNDLTVVLDQNTLVYARGFANSLNNGLKVVGAGSTSTDIVVGGLAIEAPTGNVKVEVAGFRSAAGDLAVTTVSPSSSGLQVTITSAANIFNSTALNLVPGVHICFAAGSNAINKFADAANIGYAMIVSVAGDGSEIVIDNTFQTWNVEAGAAQEVEFFVGQYLRNVPTSDPLFLERSFQFEINYPNLNNPTGDMYEYSKGNYCNTLAYSMTLGDKTTLAPTFVGIDTDVPTATRKTGADTPFKPTMTEAISSTSDCARLRIAKIDETGISTDFKSLTVTLNNNVSPEKVLCNLGARFMNFGNFEVDIESQLLFTDSRVVEAIRNNEPVSLTFGARNNDGAFMMNIPSMTMGGGGRDFPINQSVLINVSAQAFADPTLDVSLSWTFFPHVPAQN